MNQAYSLLSAPTIYKNLVIIGAGTGEGAGGSNAGQGPAGDTRAFDARTGQLVWTFHTVPRPGEFGYDTWRENSAKNRSGVNVWGYTSLDAERGILYMPLGAPNNDRVGIDRPGDNLFSSSVVAVDANTGKYLWHFQLVHHDIWDYDTQSAPLLIDLQRDGQTVPAVVIVNKTGLMFTLNRVTGKPIFPIEERPVPKSDVPGEQTSPTQPFPVKPPVLSQNTISRDNLYKGEPEHQSYCEHMVDDNNMKLGGPFMPIAFNRYSISPPGPAGGINFWGPSYDPKLHPSSRIRRPLQPMRLILRQDGSFVNSGPLAGTRRFGNADRHLPCGPTPWGELVAVNMDTGDIAYRKTRVSPTCCRRACRTPVVRVRAASCDRQRSHVRWRHRRLPLPCLRDSDRTETLGSEDAVVHRDDSRDLSGRRWTAVRHGGEHGRRVDRLRSDQRRNHRVRASEEVKDLASCVYTDSSHCSPLGLAASICGAGVAAHADDHPALPDGPNPGTS